jgi:hypothetical protein
MAHPRYKNDKDKLLAWWRFEEAASEDIEYSQNSNILSFYTDKVNSFLAYAASVAFTPTLTAASIGCTYKGFGEGHTETYIAGAPDVTASWVHWGAPGASTDRIEYSSYSLDFRGTVHTPVITMFAFAGRGQLNHTNNFTSMKYPGLQKGAMAVTSSHSYIESTQTKYKNIASSSYDGYKEPFSKQTFISSIGIYDENKNLIATAKLATPVRKREHDEYVFKLKLDI